MSVTSCTRGRYYDVKGLELLFSIEEIRGSNLGLAAVFRDSYFVACLVSRRMPGY